jgi:hypothetical protein
MEDHHEWPALKLASANTLRLSSLFLHSVREHPIEIMTMFMVSGTFAVGVWVLTAFPPTLYQDLMDPPLGWKDPAGDGEGRAMFERGTSYIWLMHTGLCCVQIASIAFFGWLGDHVGNTRQDGYPSAP